jgi:copper homeostasis protein
MLEIACFSPEAARIAESAGAGRVELCRDYACGGLSPYPHDLEALLPLDVPAAVMVRSRKGHFVYNTKEVDEMCQYIHRISHLPVDILVVGAVTGHGEVDVDTMKSLRKAAGSIPFTFHRAFDTLHDPTRWLPFLADLGVSRVLTSGGPGQAIDNLDTLKEWVEATPAGIAILPGGGIRPDNLATIHASLGLKEYHSAALEENVSELPDADIIRSMSALLQ